MIIRFEKKSKIWFGLKLVLIDVTSHNSPVSEKSIISFFFNQTQFYSCILMISDHLFPHLPTLHLLQLFPPSDHLPLIYIRDINEDICLEIPCFTFKTFQQRELWRHFTRTFIFCFLLGLLVNPSPPWSCDQVLQTSWSEKHMTSTVQPGAMAWLTKLMNSEIPWCFKDLRD